MKYEWFQWEVQRVVQLGVQMKVHKVVLFEVQRVVLFEVQKKIVLWLVVGPILEMKSQGVLVVESQRICRNIVLKRELRREVGGIHSEVKFHM